MLDGLVYSYRLQPVKDPSQELGQDRRPQEDPRGETGRGGRAARSAAIETGRGRVPCNCQSLGRNWCSPDHHAEREGRAGLLADRQGVSLCRQRRPRTIRTGSAIRFRLETAAGISAQPVYVPPDPRILPESGVIITGSRDAFLHAIKEKDGSALWRFPAGDPIVEAAVIGPRVFARHAVRRHVLPGHEDRHPAPGRAPADHAVPGGEQGRVYAHRQARRAGRAEPPDRRPPGRLAAPARWSRWPTRTTIASTWSRRRPGTVPPRRGPAGPRSITTPIAPPPRSPRRRLARRRNSEDTEKSARRKPPAEPREPKERPCASRR